MSFCVKHVAWRLENDRQRVQSGPLDNFAKCENDRKVIDLDTIH